MQPMDILIMILAATLILGFLVFIHEGGHFLVARAFGVRVTEFMLGLPGPNIGVTWKGTKFGVTALPLGGYANVCGMTAPTQSSEITKKVLAYVYAQGTVLLEDVQDAFGLSEEDAYNVLEDLAEWGSIKRPLKRDEYNVYRTPAMEGFEQGQAHVNFDPDALYETEERKQYFSLPFWKRSLILLAGPVMNLLFALVVFLLIYSVLGVDVTNTVTGEVKHMTLGPLEAIQAGLNLIGMTAVAIVGLFNPATAAETVSQSSSIIGIAVMSKTAVEAGFMTTLMFSAIISISLGLMNLLPIPPLDGGRFVVEIFQKISKKAVSVRVLNYLSFAGMALFIGLFIIMANQDIQRFIFGNWS